LSESGEGELFIIRFGIEHLFNFLVNAKEKQSDHETDDRIRDDAINGYDVFHLLLKIILF
jgi:hypothetical protein